MAAARTKLAYTWNVFNPGDEASPYPKSYLTLRSSPAASTALTLTHLPVLERFVKLNAMGWHTYLDMVDAGVARRAGGTARGLYEAQCRDATASTSPTCRAGS